MVWRFLKMNGVSFLNKSLLRLFFLSVIAFSGSLFLSCSKKSSAEKSIVVFIPGIIADSPTYAKVASGVTQAVDEYNSKFSSDEKVNLTVIEAGTTQSEWGPKITALAATGKYDLIVSSNPSLPELCEPVARQFPKQKFILLDAFCEGNAQIASVSYNQRTQSFLSGYMAGLWTKTNKLGLVAAQEYPIMNEILYPYFEKGAKSANPDCGDVDFRIVGNWYDASKGSELTRALASTGVDVILPICGGASQGVIATAKELGLHLVWFDENGFKKAPGTIISCTQINQDKVAREMILQYLAGEMEFGKAKVVGTLVDGYMKFITDDEGYQNYVPEEIRAKMNDLIESVKAGKIIIE